MLHIRFARQDGKGTIYLEESAGKEIKAEEIIRLQASVPHQIYTTDDAPATAWLIAKHYAGSPVACVGLGGFPNGYARTFEQLQAHPERYPLLASGLAERIFIRRESMQLDMPDVSKEIRIDRAQISRIENARTNPHLDVIQNICGFLRIDWQALLLKKQWLIRKCGFAELPSWRNDNASFSFELKSLRAGETKDFAGGNIHRSDAITALIVMQGDTVLATGNELLSREFFASGDVCYLRHGARVDLQALEESRVLFIK